MLRIKLIALVICFLSAAGFAQDTVKKSHNAKPHHIYKYTGAAYHRYKIDSAAKAAQQKAAVRPPAIQQAAVNKDTVKKDTTAPAPAPANNSLNSQYQYLLSKVYHYQQPLISALWKNASDTLNINRARLNTALKKLSIQSKTIDSLNTQINAKDAEINKVDGIEIFGLLFSKTAYNLIVWGLVILFGVIALVVIIRSGSLKREATYRTQLYSELEEEFKTYKTKANEKEKKLARELQTERNKLDELLGR
ncbi:hypothetical protein [Mucilaginibacter gotjawali]|uniref:Uncharacterized protein n=2 Tax=Mucilaginibacter gotjawali TaxID=1550579 RepID=A0A839SMG0_9SPHI|nr:hypothetical protein [Mucilaginibacter gotjawali]MBB3059076.1 hypothetical protein [Mucilaginibacter gotjawali]BAU52851.1 hypothetical protein MgSA37_01015 [Mucilaginibacter gotjawali]